MEPKTIIYRFDSKEELNQLIQLYGREYFCYIPHHSTEGFLYEQVSRRLAQNTGGVWTSATLSEALADSRYTVVTFAEAVENKIKQTNKMKVGDIVKCNKASGSTFLRTWNTYELVDQNIYGNWQVKQVDSGELSAHWYKSDRFEVIASSSKSIKRVNLIDRYKTVSGNAVKFYTVDGDNAAYPVVGVYKNAAGAWVNTVWTADGLNAQSDLNLVLVPNKQIVILSDGNAEIFSDGSILFESKRKKFSFTFDKDEIANLHKLSQEML